jgi:hypothetical protein
VRLDNKVDWREVAELVRRSYRMTAPKKLASNIALRNAARPINRLAGRRRGEIR